ncbi:MAG: hypothetical protein ACRDJI_11530 [Actinomycetota bacterium]
MAKSVDGVDELFEAALGEFTQQRDKLAARLRDEGRIPEANEVKKLRRPTVVAWAVNQLARRDRDKVARLLKLQRDIGQATSRERINELSGRRRELVAQLLDRAASILEDAGHSATAQTKQKLTQTLLATNSDEERRTVAEGRLLQEITTSSFGDAGVATPKATRTPTESRASTRARDTVQRLTTELKEARSEVQRLTREARRLNAQAQEAEKQAQAQDRAVTRLERRLEEARRKLKKLG